GEILVDGLPLRALDLVSWRERIAVVSQDVFVFNATVRDNIAYGRLDASDDDIVAAAKQANAHDFIAELPQGYLTKVGDRGVRLSGGQLQRLTLARAIVRDPAILILDEATNSLDAISEHLIQEALETLSMSRTVIIIAHRFSTIERADHIIVLDHGRLREQGSLDSLLTQRGLFSQLYAYQHHTAPSAQSYLDEDEELHPRNRLLSLAPAEPRRSPLDEPLISIVIPCYDQARYLGRAIDSALSQTYRRTEIIVVDDGSSDATAAVATRYPSVAYIAQAHHGLAAARNTGMDASHGDLLVFLDADDRLLPNALDLGLECLRAHPACGFVFGAFKTVHADAGIPEDACLPTIHHDMYLDFLSRNCVGMHGTALFRRTAVLAVGKYDATQRAAEDYDLYLRISRRFPVACHHNVIAEYWRHNGNMSLDSGLMLAQCLRAIRKQRGTLHSTEQRAAFRQGIRRVQSSYGSLQWDSFLAALRKKAIIRSARLGFVLLRYAPRILVVRATHSLAKAIRRALSTSA
ncbi:MAG: glycosyltransferase, partial [bacterium]